MPPSIPELEQRVIALDQQIEALRAEKRAAARALEAAVLAEQAQAKLDALSDAERAALLQLLLPDGVPSTEGFGAI